MSKTTFLFNTKEITIQCTNEELMKDICQKFANKVKIDVNNLLFIYNGNQINKELTFEEQANSFDKIRNQINVLVSENFNKDNINNIIKNDLLKKGKEILSKHLDGRKYTEPKVNEWILIIMDEFEQYFEEKYPSYNLFLFCNVYSNKTYFHSDNKGIANIEKEGRDICEYKSEYINSQLYFFFFLNFKSVPSPTFEPTIISYGNKLLYEIFDERNYGKNMDEYCARFNKEITKKIAEMRSKRRCLNIIFTFKKPLQNFSYNYRTKCNIHLTNIIQTFFTSDTEIWHFLFLFSNDQ